MPPKKKADSLREVKRLRKEIQILSEVLTLLYDSKESKEELGRQVYGICKEEMRSELVACAKGHVLHCICYVAMQKIDKGFRCGGSRDVLA